MKLKPEENYTPNKKTPNTKDKTIWTEKRLQELQTKLFDLYKECRIVCTGCSEKKCDACAIRPCTNCKEKLCDIYTYEMEKYLIPYGISIFKRAFKYKATCEEMDRVVSESVGALLLDIWIKKKMIKVSFGAMLRWKMVYFLYGKINLFDNDKVKSLDQLISKFPESNSDSNGNDVINYYLESNNDVLLNSDTYVNLYRKDTIDMISALAGSQMDTYSKFLKGREKYVMFIRSLYALNRFLHNKEVDSFFVNRPRDKFYYTRLLDAVKQYLKEYTKLH